MSNLSIGTDMSHHVRFATTVVGPTRLPEFPYTCVEVGFDSISYVAVLHAPDPREAESRVRECWPDAKVYRVVRNQKFLSEDHRTHIMHMGFVDKAPIRKPSIFRRLFNSKGI